MKTAQSIALALSLVVVASAAAPAGPISADRLPAEPTPDFVGIVQSLLDLFDRQDVVAPTREEIYHSTSLKDLKDLKTPGGFRLQLRLMNFGVSLVEALKVARDPLLKKRMVELARWAKDPVVRSDALIAMAAAGDPSHEAYFREAMAERDERIQFAVVEALQTWRQPSAVTLLKETRNLNWSPMLRTFVAQALLSLGEKDAISTLWDGLGDPSWVVRAMSARYLGDYARPNDYTKLVSYISRETPSDPKLSESNRMISPVRNNLSDHVVAELCIASLKLLSKFEDTVYYSPATPGWKNNDEVKYSVDPKGVITIEPLIIVPPRLHIRSTGMISPQIDDSLLRIFRTYLDLPPEYSVNSPNVEEILPLTTPSGYALRLRYSGNLSYLLIEGLAGANDLRLQGEMKKIYERSTNVDAKSAALIALAYAKDSSDWPDVELALESKDPVLRFAGLEAVEIGQFTDAIPMVTHVATDDESPAFRVYGAYLMTKFGQASGHPLLITQTRLDDWPARAMSFWYLGRYGDQADYSMALERLGQETNPFVKTEISLAALRLAPL